MFKRLMIGSLLVVTVALYGCGPTMVSRPGADVPGRYVVIGVDTSQSAKSQLGAYALLASQLAGRLDADRDQLTILRLDSRLQEFYDGRPPTSRQKLLQTLVDQLGQPSKDRGTFPARFWAEATRRVHSSRRPSVVVLFSDGDNDDLTAQSKAALHRAACRLAKEPNVAGVIVCGAEPRNWAYLRDCFAPLGTRFHLIAPTELEIGQITNRLMTAGL